MAMADRLQAAIARLGFIETSDSGGLLSRTTTDVFQGAQFLRTIARYAAHDFPWVERVPGKNPFFPGRSVIRREPMGVWCRRMRSPHAPTLPLPTLRRRRRRRAPRPARPRSDTVPHA